MSAPKGDDGTLLIESCDDPRGVAIYLLRPDGSISMGIVVDASAAIGAGRRLVALGMLSDAKSSAAQDLS
jgi:hypothetical protein